MQGRIQLPATSTHYDHGAQPRSKVFVFPEGEKLDSLENQRTAQLTYDSGHRTGVTLVSGEHFTHKPTMPPLFASLEV